jgi:hypothetical protein
MNFFDRLILQASMTIPTKLQVRQSVFVKPVSF